MNPASTATRLIELSSPWRFDETLERIHQAIVEHGLLVIATIDHAAMAKAAGLDMLPTTVIIYGHPKGGTPLMNAVPASALDLPLRVLVRETMTGKAVVSYHPIVSFLAADGVSEELARALEPAQHLLERSLVA